MIVGVTGHRFYDEPTAGYLRVQVRALLQGWADDGEVRVVSSFAEGADQLVARVALDLGLALDAVLPAADYRATLDAAFRSEFDRLLAAAATATTLDHAEAGPPAYLDAGREVLARSDVLLALWDGAPARGTGGTAEIVDAAREQGTAVVVVWPEGYEREAR